MDAEQERMQMDADDAALEAQLSALLEENETLISKPVVRGETLDYAIVAARALFVLHVRDWSGQIRPTARGAWRQRLPSGEVITHANPKASIRRQEQAVQTFLGTAFPSVHVASYHLILLTDPDAQVFLHGTADPPVVEMGNLRSEMDSLMLGPGGAELDESVRAALAEALGTRAYQSFELANQPFIFRSGGFFGFGKRATTVQQVIRHLEQHPRDGIYHLWNGSLARWFRDQGATHLADLATRAIKRPESEHIALETFLIDSGMVDRPRLRTVPRRLDFGYVGAGERASMIWRIRRGRGRGYLHGTAISRSPWVHIDPGSFEKDLDATVTVVTEAIAITEQPAKGRIQLDTNATEQPLEVEVTVNVRSMPSPFEARIVRPLLGIFLGGGLGVLLGMGLHAAGLDAGLAGRFPSLPLISPAQVLPALVGLVGAVLGFLRGWHQNWAWPTWYASLRWIGRTLAWMAGLALAGWLAYTLVAWLFPSLPARAGANAPLWVALLGAALAPVPASIGEIRASRFHGVRRLDPHPVRKQMRWVAWVAGAIAILVLAVGSVRFFAPSGSLGEAAEIGYNTVETWMDRGERKLLDWRDDVLIRYHDRRATPMPTVTPDTLP